MVWLVIPKPSPSRSAPSRSAIRKTSPNSWSLKRICFMRWKSTADCVTTGSCHSSRNPQDRRRSGGRRISSRSAAPSARVSARLRRRQGNQRQSSAWPSQDPVCARTAQWLVPDSRCCRSSVRDTLTIMRQFGRRYGSSDVNDQPCTVEHDDRLLPHRHQESDHLGFRTANLFHTRQHRRELRAQPDHQRSPAFPMARAEPARPCRWPDLIDACFAGYVNAQSTETSGLDFQVSITSNWAARSTPGSSGPICSTTISHLPAARCSSLAGTHGPSGDRPATPATLVIASTPA